MNLNILNQKKTKEKENTKLLEGILKDYLNDYLITTSGEKDLHFWQKKSSVEKTF